MPKVEIHAHENGPYLIHGSASYRDDKGREQTTPGTTVALCRCGLSWNRPFCDGSHSEVGFHSEEMILYIELP